MPVLQQNLRHPPVTASSDDRIALPAVRHFGIFDACGRVDYLNFFVDGLGA
jgi:hypothetical protein